MSENVDITKSAGLCVHGNFSSKCAQCKSSEGIVPLEFKEGLPVISGEDYDRLFYTDIRNAGAGSSVTFDFQGYIKEEREDYTKGTFYRDTLATNGILKEEGKHKGIHVGTDGVISYSAMFDNHRMKSSADVHEYNIYISIPGSLQKEKDVVCYSDHCQRVSEFDGHIKTVEHAQSMDHGWIVMRLDLDPNEDPLARTKVQFIHGQIVKFIENGGDLSQIEERTRELEDQLASLDETGFVKQVKFIESGSSSDNRILG